MGRLDPDSHGVVTVSALEGPFVLKSSRFSFDSPAWLWVEVTLSLGPRLDKKHHQGGGFGSQFDVTQSTVVGEAW